MVSFSCMRHRKQYISVCQGYGIVVVLANSCDSGFSDFQAFQKKKWPLQIILLASWTQVYATNR